jgi:uroporphyrinogen decarboxylase
MGATEMGNKWTSRRRFQAALRHQEADRIPVDVGQDFHNGLHEVAYRNLLEHLSEADEIRLYDRMQHLAVVKPSVLERLHADTRYVFAGVPATFVPTTEPDGSWRDEWGVVRKTCGNHDEAIRHPLAGCDLDDVLAYRFPNPRDSGRFEGLQNETRRAHETTDFAIIAGSPATLFYLTSELIGFQEYLEKLLTDPLVIETLVDRMLQYWLEFFDSYLDAVGDYVEMIWMGDDWGTQIGPIMPPKLFQKIFLPRYRQFCTFVKSRAPVKIALHSCGSIDWALDDLVSAGIDVVHPLQGDARSMNDPHALKRRFGKQLVFYSNLCNQTILPYGSPDQVREDVRRKIEALAPGGGYIMSAGHNIQADVKPENILALFDTTSKFGRYSSPELLTASFNEQK